ncbi:MAG: hypothetical protein LBG19_06730 [Prevotellaceae bacterium]|jgi:hypothetical protein|nr:hypothetical protein [Prevotellaceae bacterium]
MRKKYLYFLFTTLLTAAAITLPIACTEDSEKSAEDLAKRFCNCEKLEDLEKRETCKDKVLDQLQFHLNDLVFIAAYNQAAQACYN